MFELNTQDFEVEEAIAAEPGASHDEQLLDAYSDVVTTVADRVGPAVVRVERPPEKGKSPGGMGSGVVISPDGLVLTNSHVVDGAKELRLTDSEGRTMVARTIGEVPDTDLALVRAGAARNLVSATLGDSKTLRRRATSKRRSVRLRTRELDHFRPLRDLLDDELAIFGG